MRARLQYCYWRQQLGDGVGRTILDFYKDPIIRSWYQFYVSSLVLRNNTITGVLYRDDPTILAWELINEPSAPADDTGQTVAVMTTPYLRKMVHVYHVNASFSSVFCKSWSLLAVIHTVCVTCKDWFGTASSSCCALFCLGTVFPLYIHASFWRRAQIPRRY